jgi:UDP-N-acetyl-D-glucosamine dehydrogenase
MKANQVSVSPWGESFPLPTPQDSAAELAELRKRAEEQRKNGLEVVVVIGLGFVGTVMAAVIADAVDGAGKPSKFVIGLQRPSPRSYWKLPMLNRGDSPVTSEDPEVSEIIHRCVTKKRVLAATHVEDILGVADVVVVDVQCDFIKTALSNVKSGTVDMVALEETIGIIGEKVDPRALILIETTVPPGTTEQIAFPIIKQAFENRGFSAAPLLAHSYERVMPGRNYVASVRDFWRVCSGVSPQAIEKVRAFLDSVLNTKKFPLTVLDRPIESETAKIIENSFRAAILAFMDEWSLFAERNGIDIKKVIEAIKVRPTHSNMIFPGPGIGGYCLPKDGGLGVWANRHILGWEDDIFRITPLAIDINDSRALHAPQLVRDALRNMGEPVAAAAILVLGVSYREDVGDTRYSGSEIIVRRLAEMGAKMRVHDPFLTQWPEIELQHETPEEGKARFFSRQAGLKDLRIQKDVWAAMRDVKAIVLAVRHAAYLHLDPDRVFEAVGHPFAIVDCFLILDDAKIRRYLELGCEVKGLGRGHIKRIKESIRRQDPGGESGNGGRE